MQNIFPIIPSSILNSLCYFHPALFSHLDERHRLTGSAKIFDWINRWAEYDFNIAQCTNTAEGSSYSKHTIDLIFFSFCLNTLQRASENHTNKKYHRLKQPTNHLTSSSFSSVKSLGTLKKYRIGPGALRRFFDAADAVKKRLLRQSRNDLYEGVPSGSGYGSVRMSSRNVFFDIDSCNSLPKIRTLKGDY